MGIARFLGLPEEKVRVIAPDVGGGFGYKWPTLEELHTWVFGFSYEGAHDAGRDIEACARAFFKLRAAGHFRL